MASPAVYKMFPGFFKSKVMLCLFVAILGCLATAETARAADVSGQKIKELHDISYKHGAAVTDYEKERCKLDLYLPADATNCATLVWFHGGALSGGRKDDPFTVKISRSLAQGRVAVVSVNYRLSPTAKYPAYIEDAAAAFAWVRKNIATYGGDTTKVFVGGHSAGGYLTALVGLDARYLKVHGLSPDAIAGLIPVSGQMMTHYTIRAERGLPKSVVIADDGAPVYHAAKETPPWLVVFADKDMATRAEENVYFISVLKAVGNQRVKHLQIDGRDHGSVAGKIADAEDPARLAILAFIEEVSRGSAAKLSR